MINEEKVKIMDRLAVYEKQEGRKYLPVSKYYRSDYIGLALIKNFFLSAASSFFCDRVAWHFFRIAVSTGIPA